ncbi:type II toxin-antitoxin system Phd/YefM family antitoxin [Candidatus Roizmanbacteria bacterium]|nr:type II toxin-antitoxin system Phd/YefM family antitoxin [Candidatus Roizmanbacteria bacterium]
MINLINITQARQNLSNLITEVVETKKAKIIIRESTPQVVLIPYEQYLEQEQNWDREFEKAKESVNKQFKQYLKQKNITYPDTEKKIYEVINKLTGRS